MEIPRDDAVADAIVSATNPEFFEVRQIAEAMLHMIKPLGAISTSVHQALGCVLAEPLIARSDFPSWPIATRDGYAVASKDVANADTEVPVRLRLCGDASPGDASRTHLPENTALRVLTGAPMPSGSDTVIQMEDCVEHLGLDGVRVIEVAARVASGQNTVGEGSEFRSGSSVLPAGTILRPEHTAVISALGHKEIYTFAKPRVSIIATGSELADLDDLPVSGKIKASNAVLVANMVRAVGGTPASVSVVSDDPAALEMALNSALEADMILTTGGTGPGRQDIVGRILCNLEVSSLWNERFSSSRPANFRVLSTPAGDRNVPHLGLPGRPIASIVAFCLYAHAVLQRLAGAPYLPPRLCLARLERDQCLSRSERYLPVSLHMHKDGLKARPIGQSTFYGLVSCLSAQGFAILRSLPKMPKGNDWVQVLVPPWGAIDHKPQSTG